VLLGGRAAEAVVFNEVSTGAADDLVKATDIARSIVTRFGMTKEIGQVALEETPHSFLGTQEPATFMERKYSEQTAREVDVAVKQIVDHAFKRACDTLTERRPLLDKMATKLLSQETLTQPEILEILGEKPAAVAAD